MSIKITPDVIETTDSYQGYYTYEGGVRVDYPGNYKINVGDIVRGTIDDDGTYHPDQAPYLGTSVTDYDYYTIDLQAGVEYSFAVIGTDGRQGDIDLWLYDPNDGQATPAVWFQEDGLRHADNFTFTPSVSDEYTLRVHGSPGEYGDYPAKYELSVSEGSKPSFSLEMLAAAIHHENSPPWSDAYGSGATVSYAFRDSAYDFGNGYLQDIGGYGKAFYVSQNQIDAFETCLSLWSESCNIDFNRINSGGYSSDATILVGSFDSNQGSYNTPGGENIGGYAFLPGSSSFIGDNPAYAFLNNKSFSSYEGDVWLNNAYIDSDSALSVNSYSFFAIMHEIGHALGLTHLGEYNAGRDPVTFSDHAVFLEDTHMYSVMSYFDESNSGGSTSAGIYSSTPMIGDIYIMQKLYGIDTSTRTENNFYGFSNDTGKSSYSFSSGSIPFFTIWDAGGNDTIDASNYSQNQNINLNEGGFSNIGGGTNNISIAYRSIIENATGGSGNDTLTGNTANNTLDGGSGNDTMIGGAGDDIYIVDSTSDVVTESSGQGTDTVKSSSISLNLSNYSNVENLTLTGTSDLNLTGNASANTLTGNSGNNTIDGGAGDDTMIGGAGDDIYIVDSTSDVVTESSGQGTDTVKSSSISLNLSNYSNVENLTLTGTSDLNLTGNASANTLTGNSGNNTIDGGAGDDTMIGGAGDDIYIVDSSSDVVTESSGQGTDTVKSSSISLSLANYAHVENLTLTGSSSLNLTGNASANTLTGNSGDNDIDGGAGIDTMIGGDGDDTYYVDDSSDIINENSNEGDDNVFSSRSYTLASNVENLTLTGSSNNNATGNESDNTLTGNSGDNRIQGRAGNDILDGGAGNDTLIGGSGNDTYIVDSSSDVVTEISGEGTDSVQSSVTYTLSSNVENITLTGSSNIDANGNSENNTLTGNSGINRLYGGEGDDIIYGGGNDTLVGWSGNDTYIVNSTTDTIEETLLSGGGIDTVISSVSYDLSTQTNSAPSPTYGLENLTLSGTDNINGTGNSLDNVITGNSGNNILIGGDGDDELIGGEGNDTLYAGSGTNIQNGGNGNDTYMYYWDGIVDSGGIDTFVVNIAAGSFDMSNYSSLNNIENLTMEGISTNTILTGNSNQNTITGTSQNNGLDGGGSEIDTLIGGGGDDTYYFNDNADDIIIENAGEGTDTVHATIDVSIASYANVENIILSGTNTITATGNDLNNTITSNSTGGKTLIGGLGDDNYYIYNALDIITENSGEGTDTIYAACDLDLSNYSYIENLTAYGAVNITGDSGDNILTGSNDANTITAGGGTDTIYGLGGNDTFVIDNTNHTIDGGGDLGGSNVALGADIVQSSVSLDLTTASISNVEAFFLTGSSDINLTGNSSANWLIGNSGNNIINGGAGADIMSGAAGDDTYYVDNSGDEIREGLNYGGGDPYGWFTAHGGTDTVYCSISNWTNMINAYNVENLILTGSSDLVGHGNSTANTITGNSGNNTIYSYNGNDTIDGGAGNDTMIGGAGDDIYIVDSSSDVVTESSGQGTDTVKSSSISLSLANYANVENLTLTGSANLNLTGNSGDNILTGNSGNNTIIGGAGTDTVVFASNQNDYLFKKIKDGYLVKDNSDSDGIDTLQSCETANFTDALGVSLSSVNIFDSSSDFNKNSFCSDILWANTNGKHYVWIMEDGSKSSGINLGTVGAGWAVKSTSDFDGDGDADILWANTNGKHYVWIMEDGSKSSGINLGTVGAGWAVKSTSDFDGDGDADILWANTNGKHYVWIMEDGSKSSGINLGTVGAGWAVKSTSDFDGDGDADILWANTNGKHYVWIMEDGSKSSGINLGTVGAGWAVKSTSDFDGDGDADILWANTNGKHYVWIMEDGSKSSGINLGTVGAGWAVKSTSDFDGDGDADILWANTNGKHYVWIMEDGSKSSGIDLGTVGAGWAVKSTSDFDGDGDADILWANTNGKHYVWIMEDGSKSSGINLGTVGAGWSVLEENELLNTTV